MTELHLLWQPYRLFPYERRLAIWELTELTGQEPREAGDGLAIDADRLTPTQLGMLTRTTYFAAVVGSDGTRLVPDQARLEASASLRATEAAEPEDSGKTAGIARQRTRYSTHGLHEYRGRFNPQVVRTVGNLLGLASGAFVLDPFCGSGTTLVEGVHSGWSTVGLDLNPLAVLISNAKLGLLRVDPATIRGQVTHLLARVRNDASGLSFEEPWSHEACCRLAGPGWPERLPNLPYLRRWFPEPVLAQFAYLLEVTSTITTEPVRAALLVILSDLARGVSWQETEDLRIRRSKSPGRNAPLLPSFAAAVERRMGTALRAAALLPPSPESRHLAIEADVRDDLGWVLAKIDSTGQQLFDAAITSPPYATALPYIDTQRLSLALLGLVRADEIMRLDKRLIGTREIATTERKLLEEELRWSDLLPSSIRELCVHMAELSPDPRNGFRRRNMAALVFQYFRDMAIGLTQVRRLLRDGGTYALIVGPNQTVLSGQQILIDTPGLLGELAEHAGEWQVRGLERLETYARYGLHHENSIRTESLLVLERR